MKEQLDNMAITDLIKGPTDYIELLDYLISISPNEVNANIICKVAQKLNRKEIYDYYSQYVNK